MVSEGGLISMIIRVVSHQDCLSSEWSFIWVVSSVWSSEWSLIRIVFHQNGLSSGCSHQGDLISTIIRVVSHQDWLLWECHLFGFSHQDGISGWSQSMITTAVSHQGGLWLGMVSHQSDLRVVFHLGVFIRMVFHQLTVTPWYHHMNLEEAVANNCSLGKIVYIHMSLSFCCLEIVGNIFACRDWACREDHHTLTPLAAVLLKTKTR